MKKGKRFPPWSPQKNNSCKKCQSGGARPSALPPLIGIFYRNYFFEAIRGGNAHAPPEYADLLYPSSIAWPLMEEVRFSANLHPPHFLVIYLHTHFFLKFWLGHPSPPPKFFLPPPLCVFLAPSLIKIYLLKVLYDPRNCLACTSLPFDSISLLTCSVLLVLVLGRTSFYKK